ncbi:MAG: hypothetical protein CMM44_03175 [Rhodospirillaceae bacterium]|nr:hypothetical protein [Rhodospirillaceae bacterium]
MIDTGASEIIPSHWGAQRIGVDLGTFRFAQQDQSANDTGFGSDHCCKVFSSDPLFFRNQS